MNKLQSVRNRASVRVLAALAAVLAAPAAMAQTESSNAGVSAVIDAIEGLAPQMGLVVVAAIGLALIGIAAMAALALGKRMLGR
jgi:hypothetical protein